MKTALTDVLIRRIERCQAEQAALADHLEIVLRTERGSVVGRISAIRRRSERLDLRIAAMRKAAVEVVKSREVERLTREAC